MHVQHVLGEPKHTTGAQYYEQVLDTVHVQHVLGEPKHTTTVTAKLSNNNMYEYVHVHALLP